MLTTVLAQSAGGPPAWAYPMNPPGFKPTPDDGALRHVTGSSLSLTLSQVNNRFFASDWHPEDHPPLPGVVAHGREPDVLACGFCHRSDGPGGPESADLMGLPESYILQQIADFKAGTRQGSVQSRIPAKLMSSIAKAITTDDAKAAATYFSSVRPRSIIRVVEADTAPKVHVTSWFLAAVPDGEREPIGQRIIEVPDDLAQYISRDSRSRFTAYVPVGSIERGKELANNAGKTVQCGSCHGIDLNGEGAIPGIAGRSPTYIFRQLYDFKHGTRSGPGGEVMKPIVETLSVDDMISLAAYASSLAP
ncbi:MAG: cytochrome C-binding protein [Bradyrhizobium sp.]|nr:cytochrome C-binding protein [Bradyrhizobium sp.]